MKFAPMAVLVALTVPGQSQTVDHPLSLGGDVKPPQLIRQVEFHTAEGACKETHVVKVVFAFVVGPDGAPSHVSVRESSIARQYINSSIQTFEDGYRWRPATRNGVPVAVPLNMEVNIDCF